MAGRWLGAVIGAAMLACGASAAAQSPPAPAAAAAPSDYSVAANWLCRPGRHDACAQDESATIISADGQMSREAFRPKARPAIDCFYVYPTVSNDPGANSDLTPGPEELFVAQIQFARFAAQCRTFAPMYRQGTLTALHARMSGGTFTPADRTMPYADVLAAWRYYLAHDNHGRGVVLFGHSQGSALLMRLISEEVDGKPVQAQLVSAIILGANIVVPDGADVGGTFKHIPACHSASQTGCVISYTSFRDTRPPPPVGIFAHAYDPATLTPIANSHALCTNPANLAGGSGELHNYFPADYGEWVPEGFSWMTTPHHFDTAFVSLPGMISAQCVTDGPSTFLAIHVQSSEADLRTHDIPGDVIVSGQLHADWGLHRIDVPEAIGNLVDIVGQQGAAYAAQHH